MNGRGVLLDIARHRGVEWLKDGEAISNDELDACAKAQGVEIRRADFVIIRTGQIERCLKEGEWGGYAGGDAPGVKFENCYWCHEKEIAAICTDTWGVEVRPNETTEANQPWHWVVIPAMGLCMGEIFYLKDLADGLRRRQGLRVLLLRPAADHHGRHRLADQSASHQVGGLRANLRGSAERIEKRRMTRLRRRDGARHAQREVRRSAPRPTTLQRGLTHREQANYLSRIRTDRPFRCKAQQIPNSPSKARGFRPFRRQDAAQGVDDPRSPSPARSGR